jgi:hypothetical protein
MIHITGTSAVNIPMCAGIRITTNTGITGTVTLVDGAGTTQAVITNPAVGNTFTYYGLINNLTTPATVTASAVGDFTVSILSRTVA